MGAQSNGRHGLLGQRQEGQDDEDDVTPANAPVHAQGHEDEQARAKRLRRQDDEAQGSKNEQSPYAQYEDKDAQGRAHA